MTQPADTNTPISADDESAQGWVPPSQQATPKKPSKSSVRRQNLAAVFGSGPGKFAIIFVAVFVLIFGAFAWRGLSKTPSASQAAAAIDTPAAPKPSIDVAPVTQAEADRRAEVNAREAQQAADGGRGYQPAFDPNIAGRNPSISTRDPRTPAETQTAPVTTPQTQPVGPSQAELEAQRRLEQEYNQAVAARDRHVETIRDLTMKQVERLLEAQAPTPAASTFSTVYYYPPAKEGAQLDTATPGQAFHAAAAPETRSPEALGNKGRRLLIKTGNTVYAELDAEMNTDESKDVFATIYGGSWGGAKIIGRLEQQPNNVQLKFSTLAPKDGRPTMRINAVALREEDLKQGMATDINHHTISRYASLAASSLLSGFGQAYAQTPGTTVIAPGGTVLQTTTEPSGRQVLARSVGEFGNALSSEAKTGFSRPPTYSAPARTGFILFFMQDVHEADQ